MPEINEKLAIEIKNASETIYNLSKKIAWRKTPESEITELNSKEAIQYAVNYDRFNAPQKYYHFQYLKWICEIRFNQKNKKYKTICKNYELKNIWIKNKIEEIGKIIDHSYGGNKEIWVEVATLPEATKIFELMIEQVIGTSWRKKSPLLWD